MAPASDAFPVLRFSSEAIPELERPAVLREMYASQITRMEFEPLPDRPLNLTFAARALPALTGPSGLTEGLRAQRTRSLLGDADDTLFFATMLRGKIETHQRGRD